MEINFTPVYGTTTTGSSTAIALAGESTALPPTQIEALECVPRCLVFDFGAHSGTAPFSDLPLVLPRHCVCSTQDSYWLPETRVETRGVLIAILRLLGGDPMVVGPMQQGGDPTGNQATGTVTVM
eukprot:2538851-Rhodomonas_salina.1